MGVYKFLPDNQFGQPYTYAFWEDGFTDEEINRIVEIGEKNNFEQAGIAKLDQSEFESFKHIRDSKVSWISVNAETEWIYSKLGVIIRNLNSDYYRFDLFGFNEDLQYTVYNEKGHYDYHMDLNIDSSLPARKLSCVVQLAEPSEYEGGELVIYGESGPVAIKKKKGFVVVFPSYLLHRVEPVTAGVRRSLVSWITGPPFR
jgi:PKHD-type hydroxylase